METKPQPSKPIQATSYQDKEPEPIKIKEVPKVVVEPPKVVEPPPQPTYEENNLPEPEPIRQV